MKVRMGSWVVDVRNEQLGAGVVDGWGGGVASVVFARDPRTAFQIPAGLLRAPTAAEKRMAKALFEAAQGC